MTTHLHSYILLSLTDIYHLHYNEATEAETVDVLNKCKNGYKTTEQNQQTYVWYLFYFAVI